MIMIEVIERKTWNHITGFLVSLFNGILTFMGYKDNLVEEQ